MLCQDKSVGQLNEKGYNVVRLPRENINPLQVVAKSNGELEILGDIADFVIEDRPAPPAINSGQQVATITGMESDKFEMKTGLSLLQRLLSYLGAGTVELKATFSMADSIQFIYQNVLTDNIYPRRIEKYLTAVTPDLSSRLLENLNDEGELFIITDTLKSNSFGVMASRADNHNVDVNISALKDLLSANFNIQVSKTAQNALTFEGKKSPCFGFKVIGLWVEVAGGKATFRVNPPAGPIGPLRFVPSGLISPKEATPVLFGKHTLVRIK
jgi:hypothetical protein